MRQRPCRIVGREEEAMFKATDGTLVSLAAALLILSATATAAAAEKQPLDGATFVGTMTEKGKTKADPDRLVFKNGKFRSTACDVYGFAETPYTSTVADGATRFEAMAASPKEGTITWKGTVKGNTIEGTAVWMKKGQADMHYIFEGKRKE
jgi:hypothetical protein